MWERLTERLKGRIVVLDPLRPEDSDALWEAAAADPEVWAWMRERAGDGRETFDGWFDAAVTEAAAGARARSSRATLRRARRKTDARNERSARRPGRAAGAIRGGSIASTCWSGKASGGTRPGTA